MNSIYLASSWRNEYQPKVLKMLTDSGYTVYDFRNPWNEDQGFSWSEIDTQWSDWTISQYMQALNHSRAIQGFRSDKDAMDFCDICVLLLPSGRSAHIEAGYMIGCGKHCIVHMPVMMEPDLMYKLSYRITSTDKDLLRTCEALFI